ncbi:MAG: rhodanese-related sulfurtransferase [Pseudomonadota bacterium]
MYVVAAFYQFTDLPDYAERKAPLEVLGSDAGVVGSILLAAEGVNGTIAGPRAGVDAVLDALSALPGCADLEHKESEASEPPFKRFKVRLKKEIVTMGVPVDARADVGVYVEPKDWNALIDDPDVVLVDARNDYEVAIGSFDGAIDPKTETFGELPTWLDDLADDAKGKKLAMFCTGGIRCEKATAYARRLGFADVFHLKGGILKYLETVPEADSAWRGACYVFDGRVAVEHGLTQSDYTLCAACGRPVDAAGRAHPHYVEGVSCAVCYGDYSEERRARFAERQRQMELAEARGGQHMGPKEAVRRKP